MLSRRFPLPILAAVMYLTSSRGAFAAAAVGIVAFLLLTPRRWPALAAVAVAAAAGAVAVAVLVPKKSLVNGDVDTAVGVHQGHHAALGIGIACVVTALVWAGLVELGKRLPTPSRACRDRRLRPRSWSSSSLAIVAAHPIAKFDAFKSKPADRQHARHARPSAEHLGQRALAVLGRRRLASSGPIR